MLKAPSLVPLLLFLVLQSRPAAAQPEPWRKDLDRLVGDGAYLVARLDGTSVIARNESTPREPASTLKVLTALVALDKMGADFRFPTPLTRSAGGDLCVRGEGDPFLVSEEWALMAGEIAGKGVKQVGRIRLDQTFFAKDLSIPGVGTSTNPYDAVNRALSANFNTVGFVMRSGKCLPIETQTPITDCARRVARVAGSKSAEARVSFSRGERDCPLYPAELLRAFLADRGVRVAGPIEELPDGKSCPGEPWLVHRSTKTLDQVVEGMLAHSNNFIANQILLAMGAREYGEPATLEKGVRVMNEYGKSWALFRDPHVIEEGSGIGHGNRLSARDLLQVLIRFAPHRSLMREEDGVRFKTGSLAGVSNLAGYFPGRDGEDLLFVLFLTSEMAERKRALDLVVRNLGSPEVRGER